MADTRESILARLHAIAALVPGIHAEGALRNIAEVGDNQMPAIVVYDGDEEPAGGAETRRGRPSTAPVHMVMNPQIVISLDAPEGVPNLGSLLNAMRADLVPAVLEDSTLAALVGTNGSISYAGCSTDLGVGRAMQGQMACLFAIDYVLRPDQLSSSA